MAVLILLRAEVPLVRFALGEVATLGRASECEVQLVDTELSRRHAQLRRRTDGGWEIEDLGSRNGTRVDGALIRAASVPLRDGALIELGSHRLLFDPPVDVVGDRDGDHRLLLVRDETAARGARRLPEGFDRSAAELTRDHERALRLIAAADRGGLGALLAAVCEDLGAERACLVATTSDGGLRPLCVHGSATVTTSMTLLQLATSEQVPLAVDDAQGDVSFATASSVLAHDLRAVLVAPLTHDGRDLGVLHLDHRRRGTFDDKALARVAALSPAIALALARTVRPAAPAVAVMPAIVGGDPRLRGALDAAVRTGAAGTQLLILGESGTGKELVARAYHAAGPRASGPWIAVNCAAFSDTLLDSELFGHEQGAFSGASRRHRGCFEQADGGTLFLDEVGELGAATQAKLLRVLADRRFYRVGGEQPIDVDVRVVAATHRDLRAQIAAGAFRDDLYWRLAVITVEVPPLRARGGDRATLTAHFFAKLGAELGRRPPTLSPDAQALWDRHPWPGNVRELRNAVERLLVLYDGGVVEADDLPPELRAHAGQPAPGTLAEAIGALERERIGAALEAHHGNKAATARALGISRPTLDKKLRDHGLGGGTA